MKNCSVPLSLARSTERVGIEFFVYAEYKRKREKESVSQIVHKQIKRNGNAKLNMLLTQEPKHQHEGDTQFNTRTYLYYGLEINKWMPTNMTNTVCSAFRRRLIPAGRLWSALSTILLAFQVGSRATHNARATDTLSHRKQRGLCKCNFRYGPRTTTPL